MLGPLDTLAALLAALDSEAAPAYLASLCEELTAPGGALLLDELSFEIFGPVLSIVRVPTLEAAIALENSSPYGNASAIYTTSGDVAKEVMSRVSAGMCGVNIGVPVPREPFGFGGWNDSKFGHGNIYHLKNRTI